LREEGTVFLSVIGDGVERSIPGPGLFQHLSGDPVRVGGGQIDAFARRPDDGGSDRFAVSETVLEVAPLVVHDRP
jgi:hypothetical protein